MFQIMFPNGTTYRELLKAQRRGHRVVVFVNEVATQAKVSNLQDKEGGAHQVVECWVTLDFSCDFVKIMVRCHLPLGAS